MRANGRPVSLYIYQGANRQQPEPPYWITEKCGTYAGWNVHQRCAEPPCPECRRAQAEYMQQWRLRTGRQKSVRMRLSAAQLALLRRTE